MMNHKESFKDRIRDLKRDIPAVFLLVKHPDTPLAAKLLSAVVVAYALSPIDLIPDFIPVLGYLDDVILLPVMIFFIRKLIPEEVMKECRDKSEGMWKDGKPERWYYAIPVVMIWIFVIYMIIK